MAVSRQNPDLLKTLSVLYVEDEVDIQRQLIHFLEPEVSTFFAALDGREGLTKFQELKPDIVITDIRMPNMDGLEMAQKIKEIDREIPIIVTTAFNEQDYFLKSIDLGIDKYVLKPTNPFLLLEALDHCAGVLNQKRQLELNNRYVRFIVDATPGFLIIANQEELEYVNETFLKFLGYASITDFTRAHKKLEGIFHKIEGIEDSNDEDLNWFKQVINNPETEILVHLKDPHDSRKTPEIYLVTFNRFPERDKYVFVFTNIDKIEKEKAELKKQAATDPLTGVYNRRKLNDFLVSEINRSQRYKRSLSLIMFDIDHYKNINDHYGHKAGDLTLKEIIGLVSENLREADALARWGGDEFMIITPETNWFEAGRLAEKLCKIIEKFNFSRVGKVTCSFGVTEFKESDDQESFLNRVDQALYQAKNSGRDRVVNLK